MDFFENNQLKCNKYIITNKRIGKGSSATVYLGYDTETNTEIAVKKFELLENNDKLQRKIFREIYILKNLKHPNIVKMLDYYYDNTNNNMYLFLEYCSHGSINNFLGKGGYLDEKYVNKLMKQFISAIKYLYSNNYYHRDIKPDNILLTNDYTLKITDFGLATKNKNNNFYRLCGSPLYMAPEILISSEYNKLSDIWSIGLVTFQLLYGYHPFYNITNMIELINKYKNIENIIIPPFKKPDDVKLSKECIHFLKQLLQINLKKRINWEELFIHPWITNDYESFSNPENIDKNDFDKKDNKHNLDNKKKTNNKNQTNKSYNTNNINQSNYSIINKELPWKYNKLKINNEFYKLNYNLNLKNSNFYSTISFKKYKFTNTFETFPQKIFSSSHTYLSFPNFQLVK